MQKQELNLAEFKQWAKDHREQALAVCAAQAHAELTRARVDLYLKPIFDRYNFQYGGSMAERLGLSGPITYNAGDLYLSEDPRVKEYYAECNRANVEHGWTGEFEHCPALTAEHEFTMAQGRLIDAAEPITGIKRSRVAGRDDWDKYLKLLIGACLAKESKPVRELANEPCDHEAGFCPREIARHVFQVIEG